jgi:hypothetical protein
MRRSGRIVGHVNPPAPHDRTAALNQALDEVIDEVQTLKQARWRVPETHPLRALLDRLFDDLRAWARLLVDRDEALGTSPLDFMPSVAGRQPPNLWPAAVSDDDVRRVISERLDRLRQHVAAALAEQKEGPSRAVLAEVERGLKAHERAISEA